MRGEFSTFAGMFKSISRHHVLLHFIVFIWGWTPILGRYISVGALQLVWFRIAITLVFMGAYLLIQKHDTKVRRLDVLKLAGIGLIICLHWVCFYGAIKVSNVSVTMAAFSTGTLFTAITEPLFFKRRIQWYELLIGLIIIAAICLIFSVAVHYWLGILMGIAAAFTASLFSVMNGLMVKRIPSAVISFYELSAAVIGLTVYLLLSGQFNATFFKLPNADIIYLLILAGVCTAFPFIASVGLMKHLSPFTVNLSVNMEGVYGILLAGLLFHENEDLSLAFYVGVGIILLAIFLNAWLKAHLQKRLPS